MQYRTRKKNPFSIIYKKIHLPMIHTNQADNLQFISVELVFT